jgi:hypothetical protein
MFYMVVLFGVALALVTRVGWAQEAACGPVSVGDATGVYFLALGGACTVDQAGGYAVIAHLARDDESSEVLVLVDTNADDETRQAAELLASKVMDGSVDDQTWHVVPPPEVPAD